MIIVIKLKVGTQIIINEEGEQVTEGLCKDAECENCTDKYIECMRGNKTVILYDNMTDFVKECYPHIPRFIELNRRWLAMHSNENNEWFDPEDDAGEVGNVKIINSDFVICQFNLINSADDSFYRSGSDTPDEITMEDGKKYYLAGTNDIYTGLNVYLSSYENNEIMLLMKLNGDSFTGVCLLDDESDAKRIIGHLNRNRVKKW
jgi:hypothetical protein